LLWGPPQESRQANGYLSRWVDGNILRRKEIQTGIARFEELERQNEQEVNVLACCDEVTGLFKGRESEWAISAAQGTGHTILKPQ
jgi:hypothetical protein